MVREVTESQGIGPGKSREKIFIHAISNFNKKIISTQKCLQLNCIWQSVVYMMLLFASSIKMIIVRTPTLLFKVRGKKFWLPLLEGEIWKIKNREWKYGAGAVLLKRGDWVRVWETVWNILKEGGTEQRGGDAKI